jgi:hypothetical protein
MGAKYCKEYRCHGNDGKPCIAADNCFLFKWDVARERGDKLPQGSEIPLEAQEQEEFAAWCDAKGLLWVHIPNERKATLRVMVELERQGLKKGFPDNFIAEPRGKWHGLFIELKRAKKSLSQKSPEQREWIRKLNAKGYKAAFCYGAEAAKRLVLEYLEETE